MAPKILAVSGSLSRSSSNTALLQAASILGSERASIEIYDGIGLLPLFNVDLDVDPAPPEVTAVHRHEGNEEPCRPQPASGSLPRSVLVGPNGRQPSAASDRNWTALSTFSRRELR